MTLTTEQQNLLLFGNVSRDFSDYIYNPGTKTPPVCRSDLLIRQKKLAGILKLLGKYAQPLKHNLSILRLSVW